MNRLYFLLTVMVVMLGALFATHEALAKVLTGTGGKDRLLGTDRDNRFTGRDGEDHLKSSRGAHHLWGSRGKDKVYAGADRIYVRDTGGLDYIACGAGFDKVGSTHRADESLRPGPGWHLNGRLRDEGGRSTWQDGRSIYR
jgi:hypothetical protein